MAHEFVPVLGTVGEAMTRSVVVLRPEMGLEAAARELEKHGVGGAPVVDEHHRVIGIVTMKDLFSVLPDRRYSHMQTTGPFLRREHVLGELGTRAGLTVRDVMTTQVITVPASTNLAAAAVMMADNGVDRVPVTETDGTVVGICSRHDILVALARAARESMHMTS